MMFQWSKLWQMNFNSLKCHILTITRKRCSTIHQYKLGENTLSSVDSYPYLGVTVSSDLRWKKHVDNISLKASRSLNVVRQNCYSCTPETNAIAFVSLVRPILEYASSAWDP
jgi:hypothetical protein